jgi:RHS repeat-associated protein
MHFPFLQMLAILLILWGTSLHATNAHPLETYLTYDQRDGTEQTGTNYSKRDFDRLTYIYDNEANNNISNRLLDVNENTGGSTTLGYKPGVPNYTYDTNGNLRTDPSKGITVTWNHQDLPVSIVWANGQRLNMIYDAAGTLLRREQRSSTNTLVETTDFVGGIEYKQMGMGAKTLALVHHAEGRIVFTGAAQEWQYALADHLGNTRLIYADRHGATTSLPADGIISVPAEIVQEEHYYPFGMKLTGPWIGVGAAAGAKSAYQYNGIEHVDAFELNVNMAMYRTLDPVLGRWWSVDPAAEKYMSWTPYNSMGNSPIVQIDPNGDVLPFLAIVAIGAAVFGTGNLAAQAIAGDINNLGDGLRAFGTGAVAGATLTAGFALGFGVPVLGPVLKGALILKATTTGISALGGAIRGTTTGDWSGLGNAGKIFLGNFYSDPERSFFSQTLQLTSRHSWEFLQTEIGHSYSQIRNAVGRVDRVDLYRGATFTQRYNTGTGFRRGISLGNFINIAVSSDDPGVTLENEPDRRSRPGLLRHEYGHIFDSHRWGPLYLFGIGIPSAAGAEWTENRADSFWRTYFNRHP